MPNLLIKKNIELFEVGDDVTLRATSACDKCALGCTLLGGFQATSLSDAALVDARSVDISVAATGLQKVTFILFGVPLLTLIALVWALQSFGPMRAPLFDLGLICSCLAVIGWQITQRGTQLLHMFRVKLEDSEQDYLGN